MAHGAAAGAAGAASGLDVPIEVSGEAIPLPGFAQLTVICTFVGVLIARIPALASRLPATG